MTTEVLRNMLYASRRRSANLGYVVMDEVHYLSDRMRGAVWEEVILHLPESYASSRCRPPSATRRSSASGSATVRGDTAVIVEEHRPVPLWQHVMVGTRLYDLFVDDEQKVVSPELMRIARDEQRFARSGTGAAARRPPQPRSQDTPVRVDVVERLDREGLLPAIMFIFSRAGCDAAVHAVPARRAAAHDTGGARTRSRRSSRSAAPHIPDEDLDVLGYHEWLEGLGRGIAAHHAGMLPTFKEVVEELFVRGLVKVVFATETLALGINMPARRWCWSG